MSEQQGPYKVETIEQGGLELLRVVGPDGVMNDTFLPNPKNAVEADYMRDRLNAAFLAGQRDADAGLREALDRIANPRRGTPEEYWDVEQIGDFARAALAKAKPEGAADARPGVTRKD